MKRPLLRSLARPTPRTWAMLRAATLSVVLAAAAACGRPVDAPPAPSTLVVGIDVSGSFRNSGEFEDAIDYAALYIYGRMNGLEGFVDAWVASGQRESEGITCPDVHGGKRIDYCFVSSRLAVRVRRAWIDERADGSDHQPIWTEIDL